MVYADIIVDISHENLDKSYQYAIPQEYREEAVIGALVEIPFGKGNRTIKGYIIGISDIPKIEAYRIKSISNVIKSGVIIESHLIHLAYWIKENFGATMNDALKTVIPIKRSVKKKEKRKITLLLTENEAELQLEVFKRKHNSARVRLLELLISERTIDFDRAVGEWNIGRTVIKAFEERKMIQIESETIYRNPVKDREQETVRVQLNEEQRGIVGEITAEYQDGIRNTYLIHGITGSGKTEVYMEIIDFVVKSGKQAIMLIPEIALTFQTVIRFYKRFGSRISILNSRLSGGERYDQYIRAKNGEIDIMIGPRSALFTPFQNLGLIIIDEEHEGSYKSESPPKYHAREVAIERADMLGASVILGSATPSIESYKKAQEGEYKLYTINKRAGAGNLPSVHVVDLREELKNRNKSIFSVKLRQLMEDRLAKKQQIMLFINRRGYAGFVSCRSCGHVMKCAHCDISLTSHNNGRLVCHYCGHDEPMPGLCPQCGSKYIATFGTGTQKVEELVKKEFTTAKVLRMDTDTTGGKDGHEKILAAFAAHQADILVGTQMIVKGHDFPGVTLVGIIAADLSMYANDYRASERTFQLLAQASGRAGRGEAAGEVVIQTYNPDHYSIVAASEHDFKRFYKEEMVYRSLLKYPPAAHILVVLVSSRAEEKAQDGAKLLWAAVKDRRKTPEEVDIIGPTKASLSKANDIYRFILYLKQENYSYLTDMKNYLEGYIHYSEYFKGCNIQFDFDPMSSY